MPSLSRLRTDRTVAVLAAERLAAVSTLVCAAEQLAAERDYGPGGLLDWAVVRTSTGLRSSLARRVVDLAAQPGAARALLLTHAAGALALLAPTGRRTRLAADAAITVATALLRARQRPGADGADQTAFCVHALNTVARMGERDPAVVDAALWASALQSVGSYAVSGWLKVGSASWRAGRALPGMLRTASYGEPRAYRLATRYPRAVRALSHGVVALESAMPLVYAVGGRAAPVLLGGAAALHAGNAALIGLNRFPWAFGATYPAVLYTASPRDHDRSDALPVASGALLAATGLAGAVAHLLRRRRVRRPGPGERRVLLRSGRGLALRIDGPDRGPVVVLVGGPMLAAGQWANVAAALTADHPVLTCHRAGHGASDDPPPAGPVTADDLVELVGTVLPGREIVLVGHHLSAGPVLAAADRLAGAVTGIALLDPAWPRPGDATDRLAGVVRWLRLGFGSLLDRPDWARDLPPAARAAALDEYRDGRLWSAAGAERTALDATAPPPRIGPPVLLLSAHHDPFDDPARCGAARALRAAAPGLRVVVVPDVHGDRLITDPDAARRVADAIGLLVPAAGACRAAG